MRLKAGAIRELHWHSDAEWAYVLKGTTQITIVTPDGQNYIGNAISTYYFLIVMIFIDWSVTRGPVTCGTSLLASPTVCKRLQTTPMVQNSF